VETNMTRLEIFLTAHRVNLTRLAAGAGITRKHLRRLRLGRSEPTREVMIGLRVACARMLGRRVAFDELFELAEEITVTREDGERFADAWFDHSMGGEALMEAFAEVRILRWPQQEGRRRLADIDGVALREAQDDYLDLWYAVCERAFRIARPAISSAFIQAAKYMLARE
jgi:transcriptional regulator with XRE-family HTH domain